MAQKVWATDDVLTASDLNTYASHEGGAFTTWTPAVVQTGAVTSTNTRSRYARASRLIHFDFNLAITGSGTGASAITVSLPVTAAAAGGMIGQGYLYDASSTNFYPFILYVNSTTTCQLFRTAAEAASFTLGTTGFTAGLASGDTLVGSGVYESAS